MLNFVPDFLNPTGNSINEGAYFACLVMCQCAAVGIQYARHPEVHGFFQLGATAGRTTLGGEGLQHQDGSSHLTAATVPNCRAYDPAFAGEFAVILDHGMRQMLEHDVDEFYYVTLMNENYPQPTLPQGVEGAIIKGLYRLEGASAAQVRLLGSGTLLREAQAAAQLLADDWQVASEVFSVTSFSELAREAREVERWNRLHPLQVARTSHLAGCLPTGAPVVTPVPAPFATMQSITCESPAPKVTPSLVL